MCWVVYSSHSFNWGRWSITRSSQLSFSSSTSSPTAVAMNARMTLHVTKLEGANSHHIAEAAFKAVARALREAIEPDPRAAGIPSTKGTLTG